MGKKIPMAGGKQKLGKKKKGDLEQFAKEIREEERKAQQKRLDKVVSRAKRKEKELHSKLKQQERMSRYTENEMLRNFEAVLKKRSRRERELVSRLREAQIRLGEA